MAVSKVDLAGFKKKLKDGGYKGIAGARRAVGKFAWPDEDKVKAQRAINKFFEADGGVMPPAAEPKKEKKAAKKAAKRSPKKVVKRVAKKAKTETKSDSDTELTDIHKLHYQVGTITQALKAMENAKQLGAGVEDVREGAKKAQHALNGIVNELCSLTTETVAAAAVEAITTGGNGISDTPVAALQPTEDVAPVSEIGQPPEA